MAEQHELDACIDRWRTALSGLSAEQVSELEDHVRAECSRLVDSGLSDEERVLVAAMRCGQSGALVDEYLSTGLKTNHARRALRAIARMCCGLLLCLYLPLWVVGHAIEWSALLGNWPVDWPRGWQEALTLSLMGTAVLAWGSVLWRAWAGGVAARRRLSHVLMGAGFVMFVVGLLACVTGDWPWLAGRATREQVLPGIVWLLVLPAIAATLVRVTFTERLGRTTWTM